MSKDKLIPEIRFPEFEGPWSIVSLSDVCDVYRGGTFSKADMDENGLNPCIHYGELFTKYKEVISTIHSKTDKIDGFKSYSGDILMPSSDVTPDGLAKASAIMLDNVVLGGDMNILRPQTSTNSIFLCYLLNHSKKEIIKLVSGTTVKHIYPSQIITCKIPIVNDETEQQKIASCLSSLDEAIAAHSQKLELLKAHKKGLMQNLFPQEGEKVPKYRFKEFENDGDWEEKKLGEIADVSKLAGYEFTKHIQYESKGKIIALRGLNIKNNSLDLTDVKYIDNSELNMLSRSKLYIDDLMFTYIGTIGEVALIDENDKYFLAPNVSRIRANENKVNPQFLLQYFNVPDFKDKEIAKYITSSSQPALTMENVRKFSIKIPSPKEQQKIASCLSSLDALITAKAEKTEQLKLHKKGLMQGLFPKIMG
jgi:type I restriction enzyme S subunit